MDPAENLAEKVRKMDEKLDEGWKLSLDLFPNAGQDITDFELKDYTYFLDGVNSLGDLLRGLEELSPFADDSLAVAWKMSEKDFRDFKTALAYDRSVSSEDRKTPQRWIPILMPKHFVRAYFETELFKICLGVSLVQLIRMEAEDLIS